LAAAKKNLTRREAGEQAAYWCAGCHAKERGLAHGVRCPEIGVTSYLAFADATQTFVIFDSKQGLQNVITCSGDAGGGFTVISKGFWTPR